MKIEDYKNIRNSGKDIASKILDFKKDIQKMLTDTSKLLGFWNGQTMVFESDEETDALMDFIIYEKNKQGVKLIDQFYDSEVELNTLEEEVLEGMINYHSSLFEIIDIDKSSCILTLIDLFDKDHRMLELINLGLSQTGIIGSVLYTRLIPIREVHITSGVSFVFDFSVKDKILSDISFARFKRKGRINSSDLFILVHKKCKQYGINYFNIDTT